jgi:hypothetical protein
MPRLHIVKNLDSYIKESIYYRTHTEVFKESKKVLWSFGQKEGKAQLS